MSLVAQNLSRHFKKAQAVKNVSLSLQPGEIYALIGPDGAGKTTTLRMLAGVLSPDSGIVEMDGSLLLKDESLRSRLGYMPQAYGLYADLTVTENLYFYGRLQGMKNAELRERSRELLSFVRLDKFPDRRAGALSGGMYKKLAIACAIVHRPQTLILDEPTNGVDPVSRRELWQLLFELSHHGVSIIISTPYMDEAERAHRVGVMMDGTLLAEGTPKVLLSALDGLLLKTEKISAAVLRDILLDHASVYPVGTGVHILSGSETDARKAIKILENKKVASRFQKPGFEDVFMYFSGGGDAGRFRSQP